jgi:hypothetical protein
MTIDTRTDRDEVSDLLTGSYRLLAPLRSSIELKA